MFIKSECIEFIYLSIIFINSCNMKKFLHLIVFVVSIFSSKIFAQPGSLDLNFNGTGKVITDFQTHEDASPVALGRQSDGKIIAVGNY